VRYSAKDDEKSIMSATYSLLRNLEDHPEALGVDLTPPLPQGRFLGIVGLRLEEPIWDVAESLRLQPITTRSGPHEISRVLLDERQAAVAARYSRFVNYELAVSPAIATGDEAVTFAYAYIALLRIRALPEILVPAALPCSWSATTLNRLQPRSCEATLLEDYPNSFQLEEAKTIAVADLTWVFDNLAIFQTLRSTNEAYSLAVDSLCQHGHQTSLRMAAAMLWSGIEAFFPIRSEITFKLASYIATVLEPPGERRHEIYKSVKSGYNTRSRIIHGESSDERSVRRHIVETRELLSRLICKSTELQGIPVIDAIEQALLNGCDMMLAHRIA
jgi:hypothetical protein